MRAKLWALGGCHSLSPLTWMSLSGWGEGWRVRERDLFDGEKWGSALWVVGGSCVLLAAGGSRHAGLAHGAQQPTSGCRLFSGGFRLRPENKYGCMKQNTFCIRELPLRSMLPPHCCRTCALPAAGLRRSRRIKAPVGMREGDSEDAECAVCHLYLHLSGGEFLCFLGGC